MTIPLYLSDSLMTDFEASVVSCTAVGNEYHVVLSQTAFYPEGGGQPSDHGFINEISVVDVFKRDGEIFHVATKPLELGQSVVGKIDWSRRLDLMQQHTGQHLLSAAVFKLFDAKTVGFHLTESNLTIDLDMPLSIMDIEKAESLVNTWIQSNLTIDCSFPSEKTLESLSLRKKPTVSKNIRIVCLESVECTPCGGTHPPSTGYIGLLKIHKTERYKGGTRIHFSAGSRAFQTYRTASKIVHSLCEKMTCSDDELVCRIETLSRDHKDMHLNYEKLKTENLEMEIKRLVSHPKATIEETKVLMHVFENIPFQEIRKAANTIGNLTQTIALFGVISEKGPQLIYIRSQDLSVNMKDLIMPALSLINGRGGGTSQCAQGGGTNQDKLTFALEQSLDQILHGTT